MTTIDFRPTPLPLDKTVEKLAEEIVPFSYFRQLIFSRGTDAVNYKLSLIEE